MDRGRHAFLGISHDRGIAPMAMKSPRPILLSVGATGSIGRLVVDATLRENYAVRALVRRPSVSNGFPPGVEMVVGDLTQPHSLEQVVEGVSAVVFTHGTYGDAKGAEAVDYGGVRNVLEALGGRQVRIALMTAIAVTDRRGAHDWKRRAERLVRASGMPYSIVRPGWFDYNQPDQHRLIALQGDRRQSGTPRDGAVAREQLAEVLVKSLRSPNAVRKTFELVAETGPEPNDLETVFSNTDADDQDALDGAHDMPNMPLEEEPEQIRSDLIAVHHRG
jgi:uncharacterized protein YbjT (DUF2867 family)